MTKRILLAGLLGGLALFIWGSISHMALGLGEAGIKQISNEQPLLASMQQTLHEPGFYFFPAMADTAGKTKEQQAAAQKEWENRYMNGPSGILIYHNSTGQPMSPVQLGTEFAANIFVALIAAFLLSGTLGAGSSYIGKVAFVTLVGVCSTLTDIQYWNWYGFPATYTLAQLTMRIVGFLVVGLVVAAILKKAAPEPLATAAA